MTRSPALPFRKAWLLFSTIGLLVAVLWVQQAHPAARAVTGITYSPLTAIATGPAGPDTATIEVGPDCCPSTAMAVTAKGSVTEDDFQWVELGLTVPRGTAISTSETARLSVVGAQICYDIDTAQPGSTYISQTRLTDMTTSEVAFVMMDDGTDQVGPGPTCYTGVPEEEFTPKGTTTLALKVVIGSPEDKIRIGQVELRFRPE